jgi:hypothetical protein
MNCIAYRTTQVRCAAPARKLNSWAIAAFVFSILGAVVFGVAFAAIALCQIKGPGEGRSMAIAGLVSSAAWTVIIVLVDLHIL